MPLAFSGVGRVDRFLLLAESEDTTTFSYNQAVGGGAVATSSSQVGVCDVNGYGQREQGYDEGRIHPRRLSFNNRAVSGGTVVISSRWVPAWDAYALGRLENGGRASALVKISRAGC